MGINQYIKIGSRIKQARIAKGISQKEMAKRLSLSASTYSNYENNYREPKLNLIHQICNELGTTLNELLETSHMDPDTSDKIAAYLLKDDVAKVRKILRNAFEKALYGEDLTNEEITLFNNFIVGYQSRSNIIDQVCGKQNAIELQHPLERLDEACKQLNKSGQHKVADHAELLTKISEYRKKPEEDQPEPPQE